MNTNKTNITITRSTVEAFERIIVTEIETSTFSTETIEKLVLEFQHSIWSLKDLLDLMSQIPGGVMIYGDQYNKCRSEVEESWTYYPIKYFLERYAMADVVSILRVRRKKFREVFPILNK